MCMGSVKERGLPCPATTKADELDKPSKPISRRGSRVMVITHAVAGTASLMLAPLFVLWEHHYRRHVPTPLYLIGVIAPLVNAVVAIGLIQKRVPMYDVPTIRGFALSSALVLSFLGMSLMFHEGFGPHVLYRPLGTFFSVLSIYAILYAWSDAVGHWRHYVLGEYRSAAEARRSSWFLPSPRPSYRYILLDCLVVSPPPASIRATAAPSHLTTVIPVTLVALFSLTTLVNLRYLGSGAQGASALIALCPDAARWASYNALLAVSACSLASFLGTLVLHRRLSVHWGAFITVVVDSLPVLNILWLLSRYADDTRGWAELLAIVFGKV